MRGYTIVTIICLATSITPSSATALKQTKRKLNYKQVAAYGLVAATLNALISTTIATNYAYLVKATHTNSSETLQLRDVLELVDARINQELVTRGYRRAAVMPLDELD